MLFLPAQLHNHITGTVFNPAISIVLPAVEETGTIEWELIVGPYAGAALAAGFYKIIDWTEENKKNE